MSITPRKTKKMLSGEQKYDLWLRMLTGQITTAQAAAESGVDRSTIMTVREVARDAAVAALSARPGQRKDRSGRTDRGRLFAPRDRPFDGNNCRASNLSWRCCGEKPLGVERRRSQRELMLP